MHLPKIAGQVFHDLLGYDHNMRGLALALASIFGTVFLVGQNQSSRGEGVDVGGRLGEKGRCSSVSVSPEILGRMHPSFERFDDGFRLRQNEDGPIDWDLYREPLELFQGDSDFEASSLEGSTSKGDSTTSEGDLRKSTLGGGPDPWMAEQVTLEDMTARL
ncbi:uncharacterized protein G2W53_027266 [Senna tora]|uniref:Uncharacterized protein n=1 Tax=Senna tora TaxID=362788 RepID=A0A834WJP3_9FABA|nr:uncharacterized protein G2W53_027266 [Senna tora]